MSCGFWISDARGCVFEEFEDRFLPRIEINLLEGPIRFDAKVPHCGRQPPKTHPANNRISVAAFMLNRRTPPRPETCDLLRSLGFNIPNTFPGTPQEAEQVRKSQPTLHDFFLRAPITQAANQKLPELPKILVVSDSDVSCSPSNLNTCETEELTEKEDEDECEDDDVLLARDPSFRAGGEMGD